MPSTTCLMFHLLMVYPLSNGCALSLAFMFRLAALLSVYPLLSTPPVPSGNADSSPCVSKDYWLGTPFCACVKWWHNEMHPLSCSSWMLFYLVSARCYMPFIRFSYKWINQILL
jgi:hypothetical protein